MLALILYGLATALTLSIAVLAFRLESRNADLAGAGLMLTLFWIAGRVYHLTLPEPWALAPYAIMDPIAALVWGWVWWKRRAVWKFLFAWCFIAQSALHAAFWTRMAQTGLVSESMTNSYKWLNNSIYVPELLLIAVTGGWIVVVLVYRGGLRAVRRRLRYGPFRAACK